MKLIECVPNFSEGRDESIIRNIAAAVKDISGCYLLHLERGISTNRTVMTLAGEPESVLEAAFQGIVSAVELIDMRKQKGIHPRLGAVDVCPLVPLSNVTLDECVTYSNRLSARVAEHLKLPVYLYAESARSPLRYRLADIRFGQYESLPSKLADPFWQPDYGPAIFNPRSGAIVIGARRILIAYNVNLASRDKSLADKIARNIREFGNVDGNDTDEYKRSRLAACQAIGWYVEEYNRVQVSMNLLDYQRTNLYDAFEAVKAEAHRYSCDTDGSEIVGLVPMEAMEQTGRFYDTAKKIQSTEELIQITVNQLGLSRLYPFEPNAKIIERVLKKKME